jgi:hypothetical protein
MLLNSAIPLFDRDIREAELSQETTNVEILKEAYRLWNDTRGGSVDHFFGFVDDRISFGSVPRGAAPLEFATQDNSKNDLRAYFDTLLADWKTVHSRSMNTSRRATPWLRAVRRHGPTRTPERPRRRRRSISGASATARRSSLRIFRYRVCRSRRNGVTMRVAISLRPVH